jgi:hypothetical protein
MLTILRVYVRAWRILTRRRPKLLGPAEFLQRLKDEIDEMGGASVVGQRTRRGQRTLGAVDFKGSSECAPGAPLRRHHWQSAGIGIKRSDE